MVAFSQRAGSSGAGKSQPAGQASPPAAGAAAEASQEPSLPPPSSQAGLAALASQFGSPGSSLRVDGKSSLRAQMEARRQLQQHQQSQAAARPQPGAHRPAAASVPPANN